MTLEEINNMGTKFKIGQRVYSIGFKVDSEMRKLKEKNYLYCTISEGRIYDIDFSEEKPRYWLDCSHYLQDESALVACDDENAMEKVRDIMEEWFVDTEFEGYVPNKTKENEENE